MASAVLDLFSSVYTCASARAVGDPVYLSAADTVALADGTNNAKMPCIGIIFEKPTTTTCIVQYGGEFAGLSGLVAGTTYYCGIGVLNSSTAGLTTIQSMGVARNTTTLTMAVPQITGNSSITGTLAVSGATTINNTLNVDGDGATNGITVDASNNVTLSKAGQATVVGGTFKVVGNAGFYNTAVVAQPANTVGARAALVTLGLIASGGNGLSVASRIPIFYGRNSTATVIDATGGAGKFSLVASGNGWILQSETANNNTKTDVVLYEFVIPEQYIAAQNLTLSVNCTLAGPGTSGASTLAANIYKYADAGTVGADIGPGGTVTFINTSDATKTFAITGATLSPGDRVLVKLTAVVVESASSNLNGNITSVRIS
jgi:hypothetical protein